MNFTKEIQNCGNSTHVYTYRTMGKDLLEEILEDLDEDDRISILFLMIDKDETAEVILKLCQTQGLKNSLLKISLEKLNTFVECVKLIKNFYVLRKMRLNEIDVNIFNVNWVVKNLYTFFDSMTSADLKILKNKVIEFNENLRTENDFQLTDVLLWIKEKYISISDPTTLWKKLFVEEEDLRRLNLSPFKFPWENLNHKRFCMIINNFEKTRLGSKKDRENLQQTLIRCGFFVECKVDVTKEEMDCLLHNLVLLKIDNNYSSVFLVIMSHGLNEEIFFPTQNSSINEEETIEKMTVKEITNKFCTPQLQNALKFMIMQVCRGKKFTIKTNRESNIESDGPSSLSDERFENLGVYQATLVNSVAIREENGSLFIQSICNVLKENQQDLLLNDFVLKVNSKVTSHDKIYQCSEIKHTFTGKYYIPAYKYL